MTTVDYNSADFLSAVEAGKRWARISDTEAIIFDTTELYYTWLESQE